MTFYVKVTRKYQITLPKKVREMLKIRIGDLIRVSVKDNKIILEPVIERTRDPVEDMLNLIKEPMNIDAVKLVEESWNED